MGGRSATCMAHAGLWARSVQRIGIGIQAEMERSDILACIIDSERQTVQQLCVKYHSMFHGL